MKKILFLICLIFLMSISLSAGGNKSIYIKSFKIGQGLNAEDLTGEHIKDYISEVIIDSGRYTIISEDEVKQVVEQEELKMAVDSCSEESCIKTLMKSLQTDFIIYGTVSYINGKYYLTAKILDRAGETITLARVKTLVFRDVNKMRMASTDLAGYLIDGKSIEMERYDDDYRKEMEANEKRVPSGLSVYGVYFTPGKKPLKTFYDSFIGGGIEYTRNFDIYYSLFGGLSYMQGSDNITGSATVSINTYTLGVRAGFPTLGFIYPYIGAGGDLAWFNERADNESSSFPGYGINGFAGCAFIIWDAISIWGDYSYSFMKLNDSVGTDISGTKIRCGLSYKF